MPKRIFDFGMYDASDTIYYLEEGFSVVAVEANPALVQRARSVLSRYISDGKLDLVHAAISTDNNDVELTVCGDDLGSSSVIGDWVAERTPIGKYTVRGITTDQLIERYGVPYYLKIDIEGADHLCVKSLSDQRRLEYLSFEVNGSLDELIGHLTSIGYSQFKLINQTNFREMSNEGNLRDRLPARLSGRLGTLSRSTSDDTGVILTSDTARDLRPGIVMANGSRKTMCFGGGRPPRGICAPECGMTSTHRACSFFHELY